MKKLVGTTLLLFFLAFGCNDLGTLITSTTSSDDHLRQALIGNWSTGYERLSFQVDGTFRDTSIMVVQSGTEPKDTMREVRSGAYSVENSVVAYSDTHFTYWTASGKPWSGFADASTPQLLRINGDSLQLTPTNILTRLTSTGSVSQLAGTWRSVEWRLMIRADSLYPKLESRLEIVCTFGQDSSTYGETWQYLDLPQHPVETYHGTYRYSPPNLEIRKGDTTSVRVAIVFSKMYWFHDEWSRRLIRIK